MKIAKKYELVSMIGRGTFGCVYKAKHLKTDEPVAVKLEKVDRSRVLKHETTVLNYLYAKSCRNIPPVYMYGIVESYAYLVIPFYEERFVDFICSDPRTKLPAFFASAIRILGNIHKHGVVHRDIKPDNWMINGDQVVLIDFGLSTFYLDENGRHVPPVQKTHIVGTPKYVSIRVHEGHEYTRRDDLISLAYTGMSVLLGADFCWGTPFREYRVEISHESNAFLLDAKRLESVLSCIPEGYDGLTKYVELVYSLDFAETPDYEALANLFSGKNDINDMAGGSL